MIKSIKTIEGLSGTGKSHIIRELCFKSIEQESILYITYNRKVMESTRMLLSATKVKVYTIHALMYQELKHVNILPTNFRKMDCFDSYLSSKDFHELEDSFLEYFSLNHFSTIQGTKTLFVDEWQNIAPKLKEAILLITRKLDVSLYLVGDRFQYIYEYLHKCKKNNFETIEEFFCSNITDSITLNTNRRSSESITSFVNEYLKRNLPVSSNYLYDTNESKDRQTLIYFSHKVDEFEYVKKQIKMEEGKIIILSRFKRNLKIYNKWIENSGCTNITASTIHSYIGNEAKTVFIVAFETPKSLEEKRILYMAMTRASSKLIITSSYPFEHQEISKLFGNDLIQLVNNQRYKKATFKQLPNLKANSNLTLKKFNQCSIDSITLKVYGIDAPYERYVHHQPGLNNNYQKSYIDNDNPTPIKVSKHNSSGMYCFELKDVNLLRRSGYTDKQVLAYLSLYIMQYFNNQIGIDKIYLHNIDICKLIMPDNALFQQISSGIVWNKTLPIKVYKNKDRIHRDPLYSFTYEDLIKSTVYINYTSSRTKDFTIALYRPCDKSKPDDIDIEDRHFDLYKDNRYHNKSMIKVECRYSSNGVRRKYAFGKEHISVAEMNALLSKDKKYIEKVFDNSIDYRFRKVEGGPVHGIMDNYAKNDRYVGEKDRIMGDNTLKVG